MGKTVLGLTLKVDTKRMRVILYEELYALVSFQEFRNICVIFEPRVLQETVAEVYCRAWGEKEKGLLQKAMLMYVIDEHMHW